MANDPQDWTDLALQLRADVIRCTTMAGSGHPTSCLSAADLMAVLLGSHLHWDASRADALENDCVIFSKGHAAPLLYAMLKASGLVSDDELLTLRRAGSRLEGHPTPKVPGVRVATGSLGQGLSVAVGMALSSKRLDRSEARFWVLLGDSEMAEGSIYEALATAAFYGLDHVIAILDMNRLGQRGPTMLGWEGDAYAARARAFGWDATVIDGHDLWAIDEAYAAAERAAAPTLIVARTKKGAGVSFLEDREGWHGRALSESDAERALRELGIDERHPTAHVQSPRPRVATVIHRDAAGASPCLPGYRVGENVATRSAFGDALAAVGDADSRVVVLDGEVSNSTYTDRFAKAQPDRFFEMYIAEQQLVGAATGMQTRGCVPFAATFAAFFTRAHDQLRMAAISGATVHVIGSHAGVSIGEDGPSQMGLEDLAMMRAVHGSTVLYPCCANATAHLVTEMVARQGIHYLRTTRGKTPVLYDPSEPFPIGGSKVLRASDRDAVAIIAAGVTVQEALRAHEQLASRGIDARVIDLYSIKPVDRATLRAAASACPQGLVVVEDHRPEGGIGDAVAEAFEGQPAPRMLRLAVRTMPGSATPDEQLELAGISARAIVGAVEKLIGSEAKSEGTLDRLIDEEGLESFPASDPPAWTSMHAGSPSRQGPATARSSTSPGGGRGQPGRRGKRSPGASSR